MRKRMATYPVRYVSLDVGRFKPGDTGRAVGVGHRDKDIRTVSFLKNETSYVCGCNGSHLELGGAAWAKQHIGVNRLKALIALVDIFLDLRYAIDCNRLIVERVINLNRGRIGEF